MIIHIVSGEGNYIAVNHIVAATEAAEPEDAESCFATQVEAMLSTGRSMSIDIIAVQIEKRFCSEYSSGYRQRGSGDSGSREQCFQRAASNRN